MDTTIPASFETFSAAAAEARSKEDDVCTDTRQTRTGKDWDD